MEVGRKRDPDSRHKGARLSESAGKKEEKDGKARQGPSSSRKKTKGKGHTGACSGALTGPYVVVVGAARTRCYRKRTIAPSS